MYVSVEDAVGESPDRGSAEVELPRPGISSGSLMRSVRLEVDPSGMCYMQQAEAGKASEGGIALAGLGGADLSRGCCRGAATRGTVILQTPEDDRAPVQTTTQAALMWQRH